MSLRHAASWLLDLLYPPTCAHCRRVGTAWCGGCRERLAALPRSDLVQPLLPELIACAAFSYDGLARDAVLAFKFQRATDLAAALAAHIAGALAASAGWHGTIVPVPSHPERVRWRGYDHTALLAEAVAGCANLPYVQLLQRTAWRGPQVGRDAVERHQAVRGVFAYVGNHVPESVVLVDDVITTGATMIACAEALTGAGVKHVVCAAACFA